jgi:uncharacterized membrane protein YjjP (DUF1212 family)
MPLPLRLMLPHGRLIGFLVTALVSTLLLILPVYSDGQSLFSVNGNIVFGVLAIPVVIALTSLTFRPLRTTAAIAMSVFVMIAGFSIGLFYLPSAVLLLWPELRLSKM